MKKILFGALICAFAFTSCKDDDNAPVNQEPDQVKVPAQVLRRSGADLSNVTTTSWQYAGNRAVSAFDSSGNYRDYVYEGVNVKRIESYLSSGLLLNTEVFFYDQQNRLTTSQIIGGNTGIRYDYTYNSNGTITVTRKTGTAQTQTELTFTSQVTMTDGEVTSVQTTYEDGVHTESAQYTYDDKDKPFKNVLGFDRLAIAFTNEAQRRGIYHNVDSVTQTDINGTVTTGSSEYTYDGTMPSAVMFTSNLPAQNYKLEYTYLLIDGPEQ